MPKNHGPRKLQKKFLVRIVQAIGVATLHAACSETKRASQTTLNYDTSTAYRQFRISSQGLSHGGTRSHGARDLVVEEFGS